MIGIVLKLHVDKSFVGGIVGSGGRLVRFFILVALFESQVDLLGFGPCFEII